MTVYDVDLNEYVATLPLMHVCQYPLPSLNVTQSCMHLYCIRTLHVVS